MDFDRYICLYGVHNAPVYTTGIRERDCISSRVPVKEILEGFAAAAPPRGASHISRSKSTMGFEAGQRMRAISVYSGRMVIYNGGEVDVRLRGMKVPVAGYKSTVSPWQRRSSRISCATRVIPAGKRLGLRTREQPSCRATPIASGTRNAPRHVEI